MFLRKKTPRKLTFDCLIKMKKRKKIGTTNHTNSTNKNKEVLFKEESYKIIGVCFEVYNIMGSGFLEAVYQECLRKEFQIKELPFLEKPSLEIFYKEFKLEQAYEPDFLCYGEIILEIKAVRKLTEEHKAQVINYLKVTNKRLGLLVNFGCYPKIEYERLLN